MSSSECAPFRALNDGRGRSAARKRTRRALPYSTERLNVAHKIIRLRHTAVTILVRNFGQAIRSASQRGNAVDARTTRLRQVNVRVSAGLESRRQRHFEQLQVRRRLGQ